LAALNGEFNLALIDNQKEELFLVTDRFTFSRIYYLDVNGVFIFSPLLPVLLNVAEQQFSVNKNAVVEYLCFMTTLSDHTLVNEVHILPNASVVKVSKDGVIISKYWNFAIIACRFLIMICLIFTRTFLLNLGSAMHFIIVCFNEICRK